MVGWHHCLNGREFEQTLGDSKGQESLACCSPWGCKESDLTQQLKTMTLQQILNKPSWFLEPKQRETNSPKPLRVKNGLLCYCLKNCLLAKEKESYFVLKLVISMWKKKKGQTNMNIEICGKGSLKRILCVIKFNCARG